MTTIAKGTRVALTVAVVALATAGAASADAFHPDPFVQRGVAPADVQRPAGSSWSGPAAVGTSDYTRPSWDWQYAHVARFYLTGSGCYPRCMI